MNIRFGERSDIDVINEVLNINGKHVADVGCGDGTFARLLTESGAITTGIEPDPIQAEKNRRAHVIKNLSLLEAGAQALPLDKATQDILIFRFSFHHIPQTLHDNVFAEAARVLKPGAQLLIIEPVAAGPSQDVMELFHDETRVCAQVQTAIKRIAPKYFTHKQSYTYEVTRIYEGFPAYLNHYGQLSYNSYAVNSVDSEAVKSRFAHYTDESGITRLTQPVKADLFIKR